MSHLANLGNKKAQNYGSHLNTIHQVSKITVPNEENNLSKEEVDRKGLRASIGDDAMEMIEAIERKALVEIENLRNSKIELMQKLNV